MRLARDMSKKIEETLEYPGQIKGDGGARDAGHRVRPVASWFAVDSPQWRAPGGARHSFGRGRGAALTRGGGRRYHLCVRVLFIGDVVGKPGRQAVRRSCRGCGGSTPRCGRRERRELGRGPRPHREHREGDLRRAASTSSRPATTSGTSPTSSRARQRERRSCARRTTRPRRPGRGIMQLRRRDRDQPHGPHLHDEIDDPFRTADRLLESVPRGLARSSSTCTRRRPARRSRWLVPRRARVGRRGHPHARADGGSAHLPRRHGVRLRPGDVRPARFCDRRRGRARDPEVPDRDADALHGGGEVEVQVFNAVLIEIDEATGKARSIQRVDREWTQR